LLVATKHEGRLGLKGTRCGISTREICADRSRRIRGQRVAFWPDSLVKSKPIALRRRNSRPAPAPTRSDPARLVRQIPSSERGIRVCSADPFAPFRCLLDWAPWSRPARWPAWPHCLAGRRNHRLRRPRKAAPSRRTTACDVSGIVATLLDALPSATDIRHAAIRQISLHRWASASP
jgi:hypothetical protein